MRHATMRQLRVFAAAAGQLSFARAAQELHLTPPAVSLQIAELERHAGTKLFDRLGKRLYLTKAGEAMLRASRDIIEKVRLLEDELSAMSGMEGGVLNIGVISAGDYFIATLLADFCKLHEGVRVALSVCNREELLRVLNGNGVDLAIMSLPPRTAGLAATPFAAHPLVIVASASHPLAEARRLPLSALAAERFISREQGSQTRQVMNDTLRRARIKPVIAFETPSNETIKQAVAAGFGVAFMSAHAIGLEVQARRLAVLDIAELPVRRTWFAVHRRGKHLPAVARAFVAFLEKEGEARMKKMLPARLRRYWRE